MKALALLLLLASCSATPKTNAASVRPREDRVSSRIMTTDQGDLILVQEVEFEAPRHEVWAAHTTAEGWMSWVCPVAEIDFRIGGRIQTNYDPNAKIGDEGTNTLTIVNYVPEQLLTLKADVADSWPDIMIEDADCLTNTLLFISMGPHRSRLVSYGMGYKDRPEYEPLMEFFIEANESLYQDLMLELEGELVAPLD